MMEKSNRCCCASKTVRDSMRVTRQGEQARKANQGETNRDEPLSMYVEAYSMISNLFTKICRKLVIY